MLGRKTRAPAPLSVRHEVRVRRRRRRYVSWDRGGPAAKPVSSAGAAPKKQRRAISDKRRASPTGALDSSRLVLDGRPCVMTKPPYPGTGRSRGFLASLGYASNLRPCEQIARIYLERRESGGSSTPWVAEAGIRRLVAPIALRHRHFFDADRFRSMKTNLHARFPARNKSCRKAPNAGRDQRVQSAQFRFGCTLSQ